MIINVTELSRQEEDDNTYLVLFAYSIKVAGHMDITGKSKFRITRARCFLVDGVSVENKQLQNALIVALKKEARDTQSKLWLD